MGIAPHTDVFNVKIVILFNALFLTVTFTPIFMGFLTVKEISDSFARRLLFEIMPVP